MKYTFLSLSLVIVIVTCSSAMALRNQDVLVVYNSLSSTSYGVARYYARERGIPTENLVGLELPLSESIAEEDYVPSLAGPLSDSLSLHQNVKCIALCYGVPAYIALLADPWRYSIDSALVLLGNPGVPDVTHYGLDLVSPYYGSSVGFDEFRGSAQNVVTGIARHSKA